MCRGLPFTPPDVLTAYCLFDLSGNNVIVKSPLPEGPWSLTVSTRSGENFYVVTGADAKKPEVRLLIIPQDRLPEEASTEKTEQGYDQNIIVSPSQTGIVAIRAPLRGESSGRPRWVSYEKLDAKFKNRWCHWWRPLSRWLQSLPAKASTPHKGARAASAGSASRANRTQRDREAAADRAGGGLRCFERI